MMLATLLAALVLALTGPIPFDMGSGGPPGFAIVQPADISGGGPATK